MRRVALLLACCLAALAPGEEAPRPAWLAGPETSAPFAIGERDFLLRGQPFVIRCAEMHFARIPRAYWAHRLAMVRAAGFNTVCAYLFWNFHEANPGAYNWADDRDAAEFCREAQRQGLHVILRPGPYVCAEWEFGGFPWWLLRDGPADRKFLRTPDPAYMAPAGRWLAEVGRVLAPLQVTRGGPILMVQVENEYGSYGSDKAYLGQVRDQLRAAGFEVPLFHCDGPSQMRNDARPDIFSVVNFGNNPKSAFEALRRQRATGPLMCGEFYPGWFDSWGSPHHRGPTDRILADLAWMLEQRASFSMYMAHGGTTFGLWSGANCPPFSPQTSSYDYDAPIGEQGNRTEKFDRMRALFGKHLNPGETLPDPPAPIPVQSAPRVRLAETAPLWTNLPRATRIAPGKPLNFEANGLGLGCAAYSATLPAGAGQSLLLGEVHDFAWVFVDGALVGKVDRRAGDKPVALPDRARPARLDVLIEAMGRVNYGGFLHDRKGLARATLKGAKDESVALADWSFAPLPLDGAPPANLRWKAGESKAPAFWRGALTAVAGKDTWLDVRGWGKGMAWVNGHHLGRFWNIGPTQTMFVPGCWLRDGDNEIVILDLEGPSDPTVAGLDAPILDEVRNAAAERAHRRPGQQVTPPASLRVAEATLAAGTDWQSIRLARPATGRYLAIEVLSAQDGQAFASLAELEAVGKDGAQLARTAWKTAYADSEELAAENGSADNLFDLQPTTYWHTRWQGASPGHPHLVVIDLGSSQTLSEIRLLPRQDMINGRIKDCRVYLSAGPFPGQ